MREGREAGARLRSVARFFAVLSFGVIAVWSIAAAQSAAQSRIEVSKLGPQVGQHVPDFSLKDQNGKTQTLQSIMGPKGAMLVFIRSADW
jgi:cytochrome oxidase Cu insertion factor (SCO1/SenC/PrrC family)